MTNRKITRKHYPISIDLVKRIRKEMNKPNIMSHTRFQWEMVCARLEGYFEGRYDSRYNGSITSEELAEVKLGRNCERMVIDWAYGNPKKQFKKLKRVVDT